MIHYRKSEIYTAGLGDSDAEELFSGLKTHKRLEGGGKQSNVS